MIEQFGKDVENIEHTTIAESSKLMMQLMAVMRERLQKNKIFVDFDSYKPAEFKIELDGKEVYRGVEGTQDIKVDPSIEPKILTQITALLEEKEGNKVDIPYRNVSIKINEQEVYRIENGVVVLNALAIKEKNSVTVTADTGEAKNKTKFKPPVSQPPVSQEKINKMGYHKKKSVTVTADTERTRSETETIRPTRQEQLGRMVSDLKGLELIEPLEQIVVEKGIQVENQKTLEHKDYLFRQGENGFTIHDKSQKKSLFNREVGRMTQSSLTEHDFQELKTFVEQSQKEKEKFENLPPPLDENEKEAIEID